MRTQDLSVWAPIELGETNGRRHFKIILPLPSWSKATRLFPNKSLRTNAKEYREYIKNSVIVAEVPYQWLRSDYGLNFNCYYKRFDLDGHIGGIVDDLVHAKIMIDDRHWMKLIVTLRRTPVEGLTVRGWELNATVANGLEGKKVEAKRGAS